MATTTKEIIYSGKAKTLYRAENEHQLICEFRDDITAFNNLKHDQLARKGLVNNYFNEFIMNRLSAVGIKTHFISRIDDTSCLVKRLDMIKLECVIRNIATGSLCKRLGIKDGIDLSPPIFEFFLKDDELGDPLINESHIISFGWATQNEITQLKALTFSVNEILSPLFHEAGMILVDYKLEFGRFGEDKALFLGDEFSPDGCRIWDIETREKLDKDRYRQGLGDVIASYQLVAERLGVFLP